MSSRSPVRSRSPAKSPARSPKGRSPSPAGRRSRSRSPAPRRSRSPARGGGGGRGPPRPIFCGNFEYDAREREIYDLFDKFGRVSRIDMKTGFAFVYMEDERDGEDAIRALDRTEFGYKRRRLCVEFARGDGATKQREEQRRKNISPTSTLFVVNFDVARTRQMDLEQFFDRYGRLVRTQLKKNFAFVQFESPEIAAEALKATNGAMMDGRPLTVEFVAREDNVGGGGYGGRSPPRGGRSPPRYGGGGYGGGRGRSPSPYGRRGRSPPPRRRSRSPDYSRYR